MFIFRSAILLTVICVTAACGGGGSASPTSPTPSTTPTTTTPTTPPVSTPTPQPPSNFGVFSFSFDAGTSVSDQELIGAATQIAKFPAYRAGLAVPPAYLCAG